MIKVGYLGPEGTFCEEAGAQYVKKLESKKIEMIPYSTIHSVLLAADSGEVDEGITPLENSIEGTIGVVQDMLVKEVNLKIFQEIVVLVHHNLISYKGVKLENITDIISHPQALDQCQNFLRKKMPQVKFHLAYSTAEAVKQVASCLPGKLIEKGKVPKKGEKIFAAIGTSTSAKVYKLEIVAKNINDYADNHTRFIVVSKKDHVKTGNDKTSIVFSILRDRPGGLYHILGEFAERNINLTNIESRPAKSKLGDYYFFIDFLGHREDPPVREALKCVKNKASFLKVLGSYPRVVI